MWGRTKNKRNEQNSKVGRRGCFLASDQMSARCKDESRLGRDVVSLFPYTTKKAVALGGCDDWGLL